jgi:hypothetical protein
MTAHHLFVRCIAKFTYLKHVHHELVSDCQFLAVRSHVHSTTSSQRYTRVRPSACIMYITQ